MTRNRNRPLNQKRTSLLMLLSLANADPYNLAYPNSAFYLPSSLSPTAIPSQCIVWDVPTNSVCFCTNTILTNATMMIDPSSILPSFFLKTIYGEWESGLNSESLIRITFKDMFSSAQVSGSAGVAWSVPLTHAFGPNELFNKVDLTNNITAGGAPYFKRWYFTGTNIIGSPLIFGGSGSTAPQCNFSPKGPIIGVKSYLSNTNYFCGVAFAYNTCSCTSALYMLTDNTLKTINWSFGNSPASLAWTIRKSLSGLTNFVNTSCGNFLLSPVTTSINGYTPVSIVTAGFLASTFSNPSSITLTNPNENGTFNVLLQVTNPSGYTITGDATQYFATPLYFYVTVVVTGVPCIPAFTLISQPESPVAFTVYPVTSTFTTTTAIRFSDSVGCGFVPSYSCWLSSGVACPSWIAIDAANKMTVNTNNPANIGQQIVTIKGSYVSSLGATVALLPTTWVLNVNVACLPSFTLASQPESPFFYTEYTISSTSTTTTAIQFTDSNGCGILPTYSCLLSSGAACPSWIAINALNQMTIDTNNPANIGQQTVNIQGSYLLGNGVTYALTPTTWVLNVKECTPAFTLTSQPESPIDYAIHPVSSTFATTTDIQFTDSNGCGIAPSYSCWLSSGAACPSWITIDAANKMTVNTNSLSNVGQQIVSIRSSYVSQLGAIVPMPPTAWVLNIDDPCAATSFLPVNIPELKALVGLQTATSYGEFQNAYGSSCGPQTASISPSQWKTLTATGSHAANNFNYTLGIDASGLTEGQTFTEAITVSLDNYPIVTSTFLQKVTVYSATLSQVTDQTYITSSPELSVPFLVQWLPEAPSQTDPTFFFVTGGLVKTFNASTPANQALPNSLDFKIKVQPTSIAIYSVLAKNAGSYQVQYSVQFKEHQISRTFQLKIVQQTEKLVLNVLPDFVTPNTWPTSQVILGCNEAFVKEVPDCEDANNDICTEKIELGAAVLFAQYDLASKKIYIERDKLTSNFQGDYELKVSISDGVGTTVRTLYLTVACNNLQPFNKKILTNQWLVKVDEIPLIPTITRLSNTGLATIAFSELMRPVNHTNITNGTINANDMTWPALAIQMKPYDLDKVIDLTWKCVNYTSTSLELQLNFTHPNQVSYSSPRDKIQITFWGQPLFASYTGKYVQFGYNVTYDVPAQIDLELGLKFAKIGSVVGQVGNGLVLTAFFLNLFLPGCLQQLLNQIAALTIIVHQLLINLPIAASAQIFIGYLFKVIAFQFLPTDKFYEQYLELPAPVPLTESFQKVGYNSKYFLQNIGNIAVSFGIYPLLLLVTFIFGKCKCSPAKKVYKWLTKMFVWNYWYALVQETYLILVVATTVQLLQFSEDDLTFQGRLINFVCAVLCSPFLFFHVFMVAGILSINFEQIQKNHPDTDYFNKLFEYLNIRTNVTNRKELHSGKHIISHPIWSILRRTILGVTVTTMTNQPMWCLVIMNFTTLTSIIIDGTQEPFKDRVRGIINLFNEFIVLVINYHLLCLTNFVADPVAREYLGYSMVVVILLFLAINLGFASIRIQSKPCTRFRYCVIKKKSQCKRNEQRKKAQEKKAKQAAAPQKQQKPKRKPAAPQIVKKVVVPKSELIQVQKKNQQQSQSPLKELKTSVNYFRDQKLKNLNQSQIQLEQKPVKTDKFVPYATNFVKDRVRSQDRVINLAQKQFDRKIPLKIAQPKNSFLIDEQPPGVKPFSKWPQQPDNQRTQLTRDMNIKDYSLHPEQLRKKKPQEHTQPSEKKTHKTSANQKVLTPRFSGEINEDFYTNQNQHDVKKLTMTGILEHSNLKTNHKNNKIRYRSQDLFDEELGYSQPVVKQHEGIKFFQDRVNSLPRTNQDEEEMYLYERHKLSIMKAKNSPFVTTEIM